jgi:hypothetical protein
MASTDFDGSFDHPAAYSPEHTHLTPSDTFTVDDH